MHHQGLYATLCILCTSTAGKINEYHGSTQAYVTYNSEVVDYFLSKCAESQSNETPARSDDLVEQGRASCEYFQEPLSLTLSKVRKASNQDLITPQI